MIADSVMEKVKKMKSSGEAREREAKFQALSQIQDLFFNTDENNNDMIDLEELTENMTNHSPQSLLDQTESPKSITPREIFCMLDDYGDRTLGLRRICKKRLPQYQQRCLSEQLYRSAWNERYKRQVWRMQFEFARGTAQLEVRPAK